MRWGEVWVSGGVRTILSPGSEDGGFDAFGWLTAVTTEGEEVEVVGLLETL
jgi:hypothetical protein